MENTITLKNGESFELLFPATKLKFLKSKNFDYYKILNDFLLNPKKTADFETMFKIIYCSYIVNCGGSLTYDEFVNSFPDEYNNLSDVGELSADVIAKNRRNVNRKINK